MGRAFESSGRLALVGLLLFVVACSEEQPTVVRDEPAPGFRPEVVRFELNQDRARPGDAFLCSMSFVNAGELRAERDYRVFLHIESVGEPCTEIAFQEDHDPDPPTSWWRPGEFIDLGARIIEVPADQAPGSYRVHAGLFDLQARSRLAESETLEIRIEPDAPSLEEWRPVDMAVGEVAVRAASLAERVDAQRSLEGDGWSFSVDQERAFFALVDSSSGVIWSSNPLQDRLGVMHLESGEERLSLPIDHIDALEMDAVGIRITASFTLPKTSETLTLELIAEPTSGGTGLSLSWNATSTEEWRVASVSLLDRAVGASDIEEGAVVLPRWLGELQESAGALPRVDRMRSNDVTMKMAGVIKQGSALLVSWADHEACLTSRASLHDHPRVAGRALHSFTLETTAAAPGIELYPLGAGGYVEIASAYRAVAKRAGHHVDWARKREADPRVARLEGAPVFRLECLLPGVSDAGGAQLLHTFEEVAACAEHWHNELKLDRAQVLLSGWNSQGYDSGHPDILPANARSGGDEGLAATAARVRDSGYLFGLHDNYQDIYKDSASWNPELLCLDESGEPRAGGVWAGGQSWMVCSTQQLAFARRNLPRVAELFQPDFYFLDTTLTTRLLSCAHDEHPMQPLDDRAQRVQLFRFASEIFGLLGLEGAREWAVPEAHFFEGLLTHRTVHAEGFTAVPIFPMVYGDCLNLLTLQSDRLDPWEAEGFLDHLLYGELPMYSVGARRYWLAEEGGAALTEAQAREPRFAFARSDRGWARDLCAADALIKNTYEVLSHLHRVIGDAPMTSHRFLRADRSAERTSFGEVRVTVNYSDEPLTVGEAVLGRYGFLIESPRFVAFHARSFGGVDYPRGACFTLRSMDETPLTSSASVRVYHAFGDPRVRLAHGVVSVDREQVVTR